MDTARDTMCGSCFKWTHRLTPGGNGLIFCDQYCAHRYDAQHRTQYAFDRYHYIPVGGGVYFNVYDLDTAWQALKSWLSSYYDRPTLESIRREYKLTSFNGERALFERTPYQWDMSSR